MFKSLVLEVDAMRKFRASLVVLVAVIFAGCQDANNLQGLSNFVNTSGSTVTIGFSQGDSESAVTQNVTLETKVGNDITVAWSSSAPSVIGNDGTVTQPTSEQGDVTVVLTATSTNSSNRASGATVKTFSVTVKAKTPAEEVAAAKAALAIGYAAGDSAASVTQNLTLPTLAGTNNTVTVQWTSSKTAVISNGGAVTRPAVGSADVTVTLTAKLTKSSATATKTFSLTVKAQPAPVTPQQDIINVKASLAITYAGSDSASAVTQNLGLPTSGGYNVAITWASSNSAVISSSGAVTRPAAGSADASVTLTATLSESGASDTKTFNVTVTALPVTPAMDVAAAKAALAITYSGSDTAASVTQALTLPTLAGNSVSVTWASSSTAVNPLTGAVTRPSVGSADVTVTLTATLTKSTASDTAVFTVTVIALPVTSATEVAAAKAALAITFSGTDTATSVTQSLTLPSTAGNSVTVTWASSNTAVVSTSGAVTRPAAGSADASVTLTATLSKTLNGVFASDTQTFLLTVMALPVTPAMDVASAKSSLAITFATGDSATSVTQALTLPTTAGNGVAVTWASSNTAVVSTSGAVTRPSAGSADASVTLTATLTKSTASDTKTFSLTVKALPVVTYTVSFSTGSGSAVASVTVNSGALLTRPTDPVLSGSTFGGWYKDSGLSTAWTFATDVVTANLTLYAKWTANSGAGTSINVGYRVYQPDGTILNSAPTNGILFSAWVKIAPPQVSADGSWTALAYGKDGITNYWNTENLDIHGTNWALRFITGNANWNNTSKVGWYNANSMLMANNTYIDDYSSYTVSSDTFTSAGLSGWIWVAWQAVIDVPNQAITLRQWLKFGTTGKVFAAGQNKSDSSTPVSFATVRASLASQGIAGASTWVPGAITDMTIGLDNGYMTKVRIEDRTTQPTLAELETYSAQTAPDAAAWAWYPFEWRNGAPYLKDESGNGRDLSVRSGGVLVSGVTGPY